MALELESLEPGTLVMLLPRSIVNSIEQVNNSVTEESRNAALVVLELMGPNRLKGLPYIRSFGDVRAPWQHGHIGWGNVAFYIGLQRTKVRADSRSSSYTRAHSIRRPIFFLNGSKVILELEQCVEVDSIPKQVLDKLKQNLNDN